MHLDHFIFSEERGARVRRHLLFWTAWGIYFSGTYMAFPFLEPEHSFFRNIPYTLSESIIHLAMQALVSYTTLYLILPVYTRRNKLLRALLLLAIFWALCFPFTYYMAKTVIPALLQSILPEKYVHGTTRPIEAIRFSSRLMVLLGMTSTTIFMASFKYIKQWYLKEQRNIQLQKENTEAQLQLLTAQVHPHFLFNTLNNIYSKIQTQSPEGSKMIMGLSDLLRYILYEGRKPMVPLDKELQMIIEYVNLEKIGYGKKLDLHYLVEGASADVYIAPLLILPFVEYSFMQEAGSQVQNPWINLTIEVKDTVLMMKLMNGKTVTNETGIQKPGIGIVNVQQRLDLLYHDKYALKIREEEDVFVVDLKVELVKLEKPQTLVTPSIPETLYV